MKLISVIYALGLAVQATTNWFSATTATFHIINSVINLQCWRRQLIRTVNGFVQPVNHRQHWKVSIKDWWVKIWLRNRSIFFVFQAYEQKRALLQPLTRTQLEDLVIHASELDPSLPLFPGPGDVDQFQLPRQQQRIPSVEMNDHSQYNHARLLDQNQQQTLPMTPMHDAQLQSQLESPIYGPNTDLPHYELMIVHALNAINDPNGCPPKQIWDWMNK